MFAIRRYADADHGAVRDLFIQVNRELGTPALRDAFDGYVAVSLREEIDRLADYYAERTARSSSRMRRAGLPVCSGWKASARRRPRCGGCMSMPPIADGVLPA
jgi:hypothetical protein